MKFKILILAFFVFPLNALAQPWSPPQSLAGVSTTGGMFVDPNGTLFFNQMGRADLAIASERPFRQFLKNNDTISEPIAYPFFPTNSGISQKGAPVTVVQDLNGDRIVVWTIGGTVGGFPVMTFQRANGRLGPNSVSLGGNGAISFRNGLVIALFQSPNGQVLIKEWTVGGDGTLTANPAIPPLLAAGSGFGGCGGAIGIDPDSSAVAIFKGSLQVRSANRAPNGVWTLSPTIIDSVTQNVETMGCVSAAANPAGRIVAAWWNTQVGDGSSVDRGGSVKAVVREPGAAVPGPVVTMLSSNPSIDHSRRDNGVSVAVGMDGTVGVIASTTYCVNKSLFFSQGVLRLAGPSEDFVNGADSTGIAAMDSSTDKIWVDVSNHTPVAAFAVENRKAVFGVHAVAYPNVGTNLRPSCGPGQQILEPQTVSSTAIYFDGVNDILSSQEIQSFITQPGTFNLFQGLADAALDFSGNAAITRAPVFGKTSDVIFRGDWESGKGGGESDPQPTPTATPVDPQPTPTATPQVPQPTPTATPVTFSDTVKAQVDKALLLLATAKKPLPTGSTKKDKEKKSSIVAARKDLNGIIAILIGLLKTESTNISEANFRNFTGKNLKDIKASIKIGNSKNLSAKNQAAGWKKAKGLLSKLAV